MSTYSAKTHSQKNQSPVNNSYPQKPVSFQDISFENKRPDHLVQRKLIDSIQGSVIQLNKDDAKTYINTHKVGMHHFAPKNPTNVPKKKKLGEKEHDLILPPTRAQVRAFIDDSTIDLEYRIGLVVEWNKGLRFKLNLPKDSKDTVMDDPELLTPDVNPYLNPVMSPTNDNYDGMTEDPEDLLSGFKGTGKLYDSTMKKQNDVQRVTSFVDAARIIRGAQQEKDLSGYKSMFRSMFFIQMGSFNGLFENKWGNDYVFRPVKSTDDQSGYQRDGGTAPWKILLAALNKSYTDQFKEIMHNIIEVITKNAAPLNDDVFEVVGAMICDCKYSITGFLEYVKNIESELPNLTGFDEVFGSKGKYQPVLVDGGRKLPLEKRKEISAPNDDGGN